MAKNISKSVSDKSISDSNVDKNKDEIDHEIEGVDVGLSSEFITFLDDSEAAAKKMATRRKIEMYWEKKRLQEQLGDFEDPDLDF